MTAPSSKSARSRLAGSGAVRVGQHQSIGKEAESTSRDMTKLCSEGGSASKLSDGRDLRNGGVHSGDGGSGLQRAVGADVAGRDAVAGYIGFAH